MDYISQLGLDSWGGFFSFVASAAFAVLPFFWKRARKAKKAGAKITLNKDAKLVVINDGKYWLAAEGKITGFEFAKSDVPVSKHFLQRHKKHLPNPLLAVVEFVPLGAQLPCKARLYIGDESFSEGGMVKIRYNPPLPAQALLAD